MTISKNRKVKKLKVFKWKLLNITKHKTDLRMSRYDLFKKNDFRKPKQ